MPISGFKPGQSVLTPSGLRATVVSKRRFAGREKVTVRYEQSAFPNRTFDAAALRVAGPSR